MSIQARLQSNLNAWKKSIQEAERIQHPVTGHLVVKHQSGAERLQQILKDEEFWRIAMNAFFKEVILPRIQDEFRMKSQSRDFWPRILKGSKGFDINTPGTGRSRDQLDDALQQDSSFVGKDGESKNVLDAAAAGDGVVVVPKVAETRIRAGFDALMKEIMATELTLDSNTVMLGMGPMKQVLALKMNSYMPIPGSNRTHKELNTWFYGVEYGTGIAENVGGGKWVRTQGPTKDRDPLGSWWVGPKAGTGAHFIGQKGMNIFYNRSDRLPKSVWVHLIAEEWPKFINKYLLEREGTATIGWGA